MNNLFYYCLGILLSFSFYLIFLHFYKKSDLYKIRYKGEPIRTDNQLLLFGIILSVIWPITIVSLLMMLFTYITID